MTDFPRCDEDKFNKWLVDEYFKHGSVDEVLKSHNFDVPISYAQYQRILDKWGVVKAAGPNNKLTEALDFFYHLAEKNIPLEDLYKRMPTSFRTSAATMYRILSYIKEGVTRRMGAALIITPHNDPERVLVARDVSVPRMELGKPYNSLSIPMGFSRKRDPREDAILRVLQQEVFMQQAIDRNMPKIIPQRPKPFMFLDIADVRVEVFHITLPGKWLNPNNFSSYKLKNHKFISIKNLNHLKKKNHLRAGVFEAISSYKKYRDLKKRKLSINPLQCKSDLNYFIVENNFNR